MSASIKFNGDECIIECDDGVLEAPLSYLAVLILASFFFMVGEALFSGGLYLLSIPALFFGGVYSYALFSLVRERGWAIPANYRLCTINRSSGCLKGYYKKDVLNKVVKLGAIREVRMHVFNGGRIGSRCEVLLIGDHGTINLYKVNSGFSSDLGIGKAKIWVVPLSEWLKVPLVMD